MRTKTVLLLAIVVLLTGCASVTKGTKHPMKIETRKESGELVSGADCTLTNDKEVSHAKSGEATNVRRSADNLEIVCKLPDAADAKGTAISRVNAGMFGNIILGGGIGAVVDHSRGSAYTYPGWVQLVFGQALVFDRRDEKEGQPVPPHVEEERKKTGTSQ